MYSYKYTKEELTMRLTHAAELVKMVCGAANHMARLVMLDAHDLASKHPNYKHKVKKTYKQALEEFENIDKRLRNAGDAGFFNLKNLPPEVRKKYGNITNSDYFEYWQSLGTESFVYNRNLIGDLKNAYKTSLNNNNIEYADTISYVMAANAMLHLAVKVYNEAIDCEMRNGCKGVTKETLNRIFECFCPKKVLNLWDNAMRMCFPEAFKVKPSEEDNEKIKAFLLLLEDSVTKPQLLYLYVERSINSYEEIFRTKTEKKEVLKQIRSIQKEMKNGL